MRLTRQQLMDALGFKTLTELADYFGVTLSAISQWPDDSPAPELRELQARSRNPEKFPDTCRSP